LLIVLLFFVASRCLVPMDETDLFFNLRLGEIILHTGRVPTENLLSFTYPHATDINLAWLFQILLALVHRAAGIPGTVLLKTAFVLAAWAALYRVAVRRGAAPALAAAVLALAAWAAEPRFVERPHLVTFLGLALLLLALERAESGRPRLLWLLVPVGLGWANANSCYFLAPSLLLLYALAARRDGLPRDARRAAGAAALMLPLMFATPSHWRCLTYIANHFRMPYLRPLQEYRHAEWPLDGPFFFLVAGLALVWLAPRVRAGLPRLVPARVWLPCVLLGLLGALRIRFVAEFAMLAGPALAVAVTRVLPRWRWQNLAVFVALVCLALLPRAANVAAGRPVVDLALEPDLVPQAAIEFAEQNGLRERMYNDLEVGSYLTWRGWPQYQVFQDPRINGYPEELHATLRRRDLTREDWQRLLDRFGVTAALISYPSQNPRGALFDPGRWALVYHGRDGLVFAKRPLPAGLAEIPLSFSYTEAGGLVSMPLVTAPSGTAATLCGWQKGLGDEQLTRGGFAAALAAYEAALADKDDTACAAQARELAGSLAMQLGEPAKAVRLLEGLTGPVPRTNRGFALLGTGQAAQALVDFDAVLAGEPQNNEALFGRGLALSALGHNAEALAAFDLLLKRAPQHMSAPAARQERERLRALVR
jgi:tetratricopeptide (TPR) repeat protein